MNCFLICMLFCIFNTTCSGCVLSWWLFLFCHFMDWKKKAIYRLLLKTLTLLHESAFKFKCTSFFVWSRLFHDIEVAAMTEIAWFISALSTLMMKYKIKKWEVFHTFFTKNVAVISEFLFIKQHVKKLDKNMLSLIFFFIRIHS